MILLYQMAKVASRSWVEAVKALLPAPHSVPIHCHFVLPRNRDRIAAVYDWPAAQQTIANMLMPRALLRSGNSAWKAIEAARESGHKIRVVSGIRDPVARSISLISFMADFYGHTSCPLSPRATMSTDYVTRYLRDTWRFVLENREPEQTFEWLLWYLTGAFRTWFDSELHTVFGVDILTGAFRTDQASQRISTPEAEVFLYRVEDMLSTSSRRPRLLAEASRFLQATLTEFPVANTSDARRSRVLSGELRRQFWLPDEMLDSIYGAPVVQHFYSPDEIASFKRNWAINARDGDRLKQ